MTISDRIAQARSNYFAPEVVAGGDAQPEATPTDKNSFFGADGLTFRDVLDAVNPLNHIPVVSDLFASATEHKPSTASRLVGGTLLGGPIGFVASLAGVIFENAAGESPVMAAYAALTGQSSQPTQVASVTDSSANEPIEMASLDAAAAPLAPLPPPSQALDVTDKAVLELYGAGTSAHDSYRKAQMLPYLRDVSRSQVL